MQTTDDLLAGDVRGKRVLVRSDLNVPLDADRNITDDGRVLPARMEGTPFERGKDFCGTLVRGSATRHNAEERVAAASWGALCFPRFYFYDAERPVKADAGTTTEAAVPAEGKAPAKRVRKAGTTDAAAN